MSLGNNAKGVRLQGRQQSMQVGIGTTGDMKHVVMQWPTNVQTVLFTEGEATAVAQQLLNAASVVGRAKSLQGVIADKLT